MDFLLQNQGMNVPDLLSYTLGNSALHQADDVLHQLGEPRGSIYTVEDYALCFRWSRAYGDQCKIALIALKCNLNVMVFINNHLDCHAYKYRFSVVSNSNNYESFIHLLFDQSHYLHIVSKPDNVLFCNDGTNLSACSLADFE